MANTYSFTDKIAAIKAIRSLPVVMQETKDTYGNTCFAPTLLIGLKESKDLVEAILALAPKQNGTEEALRVANQKLDKALVDMENKYYDLKSRLRDIIDG